TARVENIRTGFTNLESVGNKELIISHSAAGNGTIGTQGLFAYLNTSVGASAFTNSAIINTGSNADTILWAKVAVDGSNVYIIGTNSSSADTTKTGLKYTKSTDNGATWSPMIDMPGITVDSIYAIQADAYNIAARDNTVAVVVGDALTNGYLIKSTDGGATWTTTPFLRTGLQPWVNPFNFPTIAWDGTSFADSSTFLPCPDGTQTVHIQSDGTIGVLYNLYFGLRDTATTAGSYFPTYGATFNLCYWEEGMPASNFFPVDTFLDCNGDGEWSNGSTTNTFGTAAKGASYGGFGCSNYPQSALVPSTTAGSPDTMYVVYASQMDADTSASADTGPIGQVYRDIMVSVSFDGGANWNNRVNISNTPGVEEMFPSVARAVDGALHIIWQEDAEPGTVLQNGDDQGDPNKIKYLKVPTATIIQHAIDGDRTCWDASFVPAGLADEFGNPIFKVYPNPAENMVTIEGDLTGSTISVINAMGQAVATPVIAKSNGSATLNTEALSAGIYMANINKGGTISVVRFVKK
ncbi:MAG: hypothetical protein RL660_2733, partial [Bacteroidota bacterium]